MSPDTIRDDRIDKGSENDTRDCRVHSRQTTRNTNAGLSYSWTWFKINVHEHSWTRPVRSWSREPSAERNTSISSLAMSVAAMKECGPIPKWFKLCSDQSHEWSNNFWSFISTRLLESKWLHASFRYVNNNSSMFIVGWCSGSLIFFANVHLCSRSRIRQPCKRYTELGRTLCNTFRHANLMTLKSRRHSTN